MFLTTYAMTKEEVNQIPFKFASHLSMDNAHYTTYTADYKGHKFVMCKGIPFRNGEPRGKGKTLYMVGGFVFKTKEEFYAFCLTL